MSRHTDGDGHGGEGEAEPELESLAGQDRHDHQNPGAGRSPKMASTPGEAGARVSISSWDATACGLSSSWEVIRSRVTEIRLFPVIACLC